MQVLMKSRSPTLSERADDERGWRRDWLLEFMQNKQPKFLTKEEQRSVAMRKLNVSKLSFHTAWIMAIEDSAHHGQWVSF